MSTKPTKNGRISWFDPKTDGYRLISEAEWEFLARAYRRPKQTIFPWGDDAIVPPNVGNLAGDKAKPASNSYIAGYQDGFSGLAPAKSFPADQSGLYDFVGNVSEDRVPLTLQLLLVKPAPLRCLVRLLARSHF